MAIVLAILVVLVLIVLPAAVTILKGKPEMSIGGLAFTPVWVVGAFRLAEPNSWWARRFYDDEKLNRARLRSEARKGLDEQFRPGGLGYGLEPGELGEIPPGAVRCEICNRIFLSNQAALTHADGFHTEVPFVDAKAALVDVAAADGHEASAPRS